MASQRASTVRVAALRSRALSLAETCSIGFRSGEYGGRSSRRAPRASIASRTPCPCGRRGCPARQVARAERRRQRLLDPRPKRSPLIRVEDAGRGEAIVTSAAKMSSSSSGRAAAAARRCPRRTRPSRRAMLIMAQVSSMNTRRPGSVPPVDHSRRPRRGDVRRSCSAACSSFFSLRPSAARNR